MAMTDGPAETPSPRRYSTKALSETDLHTVTQLVEYLAANPFAYDSHVQLIKILHQGLSNHSHIQLPASYDLLQDLQSARETMNSRFALGEDLWADWIQDQILLANSLEDRISVMELCLKAVEEEPGSTTLWLAYGQWMLSLYKQAHPHDQRLSGIGTIPVRHVLSEEDRMVAREVFSWPQMMEVWKRAEQETRWRINDSHLVWDIWTELLMLELASSPLQEAINDTQYHFINRLQTPHATWDQTFQAYSNFVSRYDNAQYEVTMVTANRLGLDAKQTFSLREIREFEIMRASEKDDKDAELKAYLDYVDWEISQSRKKHNFKFELANAVYQRATLRFPSNSELWEGYAMFVVEEITTHRRRDISTLPILDKATRHCPWSGTLWSQLLLSAETSNLAFPDIGDIKHKATSTGLLDAGGWEEVLKVSTAWCGFLRRRAFHQDSTDEDMDVAEVGIRSAIEDMDNMGRTKYGTEYHGDPEYRLEKIYIRYLTQSRNWEGARESWKKLISKNGDSYEFWLRFYLWEMNTWSKLVYVETGPNGGGRPFKPTEATKVLQQALRRPNLDWPEKIIETFQHHCEDNEDAEELQSSVAQVWKAKRAVQKRREKEAYAAYEKAQAEAIQQQQAQQDLAIFQDDIQNPSKRKREDAEEEEEGVSKKSRHDVTESTEPQEEEQNLAASSVPKRDRENATVVVKNLPPATTETRLRQYFRDCGIIHSLKLMPESDGQSATASIEFDSKEDVLTAQTKDMKTFDDRAIEVQIGSGSTLYVCNFPPVADEAWIREKFQEYGEIVDIRFPSLKYDTHRRFCYVQFKSSSHAKSAAELDGEELGDNLKLLAKMSDPGQKKPREGAMYEGRELYLVNLDQNTTRADIKQAFKKYGRVESVRVLTKVDGQSKGIAYVVFRSKDEAEAALEMNLTRLGNRILNVSISTNDMSKRKQNRIATSTSTSQRGTASPTPHMNGDTRRAASPTPSTNSAGQFKFFEIQSRTLALLNIPDTVNDTRIRALTEPYGELVKVSLRPNHQGAIIEYKNEASVGKASLALEGHEIAPERKIRVGTVSEMNQQKAEYRSDRIPVGAAAKTTNAQLQGPAPIRRPGQSGVRRGGKGGLGLKRGGVGLSGSRATKDGEGKDAELNETVEGEDKGKAKSNADFKAMFLKKDGA